MTGASADAARRRRPHGRHKGKLSMRTAKTLVLALLALGILSFGAFQAAEEKKPDDKPKYTIKEIMQKAHKSNLYKKMVDASISDDEKKLLTELYMELAKNKPEKGEADDWKKRTEAINKAMKAGDGKEFGKILNCKACHELHK
jgi:hypothetical protein